MGHKCKTPRIFLMEGLQEVGCQGVQDLQLEEVTSKQDFQLELQHEVEKIPEGVVEITLYALLGSPSPVECDASRLGIKAVLMQDHRPLAFHNQALKGRSLHLSTYEKEFLDLITRVGTRTQQKWITKLLGYSFLVEYKKDKENKAANALSRRIRGSYRSDLEYQQLLTDLTASTPFNTHFSLQNGLLLYKDKVFLNSNSPLKPLSFPIPAKPWLDISIDFNTGLPKSQGYEVILVVVDKLAKFVHFMPLSHLYIAAKVAQIFMRVVFKFHGLPRSIVSDSDVAFTSTFWKDLFKLQGTELAMSLAYHPQIDGQN
ncbi:uncharacterized protein LOC142628922 [Castanea sativa]|uniref:uncharacterized protein LOC142628922 n=1 Tax=Castanea sativa TaxID=21020 RepID=UPI003F64AD50